MIIPYCMWVFFMNITFFSIILRFINKYQLLYYFVINKNISLPTISIKGCLTLQAEITPILPEADNAAVGTRIAFAIR